MTWFLEETQPGPVAPPKGPPSSFSERFSAAKTAQRIEDDSWNHALGVEEDVLSEFDDQLKEFRDPNAPPAFTPMYGNGDALVTPTRDPARRRKVLAQIARARAADPVKWADLPKDEKELDRLVLERRQAEYDEARNVLDRAPPDAFGAEFLGRAWAGLTDQTSIATMPFGGPEAKGAWGLGRTLAAEAGIGAVSELAIAPQRQEVARDLDVPEPDLVTDVAMAALTTAGFVGGIHGIAKLPALLRSGADRFTSYRTGRGEATAAARPEDLSPGQHEARVAGAANALAKGKTPPTADPLPPITPDAPENWQAIRGGIFAGESGGDYDALFGYSNRAGGPFADVKITEMTVDQAIAFSDPRGAYASWTRGKVGRTATPMGAYQIVGTTLRAAKKELGLRGDELMTPALQERLGQHIYRTQGTGAWEGYRGPRSDFQPGATGGQDFAPFQPTSRGYTGNGQVAVGDRRIDVEYVVVDASKLQKASGRFQPRDRSRITSDVWIAETAARLDPAQLMPSPTADRGAPIVGPELMIESGNGRYSAIQRAYDLHPDRAAAYRQQIEAAGFPIPEGVKEPVLIARRKTPMTDPEREQLTIDAQDGGVARMTATEIAANTSRQMTPERLATFDPKELLSSEANKPFMRSVLAALPRSERSALFDKIGALNADGRRKIRDAFFARAWNDDSAIGRMVLYQATEAEDKGELKTILDALDDAAPAWASLKADIEAGTVRPDFDITANVLDAINVIALARRNAGRLGATITEIIETLVSTEDMFDAANPLSLALLRKFWRDGQPASAKSIAGFLNRYATEARSVGRIEDKLGTDVGPAQVLRSIDRETFGTLPDTIPQIARRIADEVADPIEIPDLAETAFAKGADSPEAEAADQMAMEELRTPDTGPFGPIYSGFSDQPEAAIQKIMAEGSGEVPDAFAHPLFREPIAFIYGHPDRPKAGGKPRSGMGLSHIAADHGQHVLDDLPRVLREGTVYADPDGNAKRYIVDDADPARIAVVRLQFDKTDKNWIVTSFDDDVGGFKDRSQWEAFRVTGLGEERVPSPTDPLEHSAKTASVQEDDIGNQIAAARAEFEDLGDFTLPDGTRAFDILDDLDSDQGLLDVLDACMIGANRT